MELNEAKLIEKEITIRNLRLTKEVLETKRSSLRWLALSLGILNPGESRLGALAVLDALINFQFIKKQDPDVKEIMDYINNNWEGINEKTLRYHLLRMKRMGFIENSHGKFYFTPPAIGDRFDISLWSQNLFKSDYKEITDKIGEVIKDLRNKGSVSGI